MARPGVAERPLDQDVDPAFRDDMLHGFSRTPKATRARWFYDRRGSELFEEITALPEYYPTRTEIGLLAAHGADIAALTGPGRVIVEFGAGSAAKTPLLLRPAAPLAYVPVDISGEFLRHNSAMLARDFPGLPVRAVEADFTGPFAMPGDVPDGPRLGFFPGSTIGNFDPEEAVDLLRSFRAALGAEAMLLIGFDRIKDLSILLPAYDDAAGVTARFNLNLIERINRELDGSIPIDALRHVARWNDGAARIEMHLEAMRDIAFTIAGRPFRMGAGETIHTENSHKYGLRDARLLLRAGGWEPVAEWSDEKAMFTLLLARITSV